MAGITHTREVVRFGAALGAALNEALKDGITFSDISHVGEILPHIIPALDGLTEIPVELADLDEREMDILRTEVIDTLGKGQWNKADNIAQASIDASIAIWKLINIIKK
tara:strand:- start:1282 stop:1608 length:327 start_codon:yes stop_codon:yes gene_type:complete